MSRRPVGIAILSVLLFGNAALYAVLALLWVLNHNALAAFLRAISPGGAGPAAVHLSMGRFEPAYYVAMTFLTGALAMGYWKLWEWTRISSLVLIGVNLVGVALAPFTMVRGGTSSVVPMARVVVSALISFLVGSYLLSAKVRAAFRRTAA